MRINFRKKYICRKILPSSIIRELSEEEMINIENLFLRLAQIKRPTLSWPRQIPLEGEPEEVIDIVNEYAEFMKKTILKNYLLMRTLAQY